VSHDVDGTCSSRPYSIDLVGQLTAELVIRRRTRKSDHGPSTSWLNMTFGGLCAPHPAPTDPAPHHHRAPSHPPPSPCPPGVMTQHTTLAINRRCRYSLTDTDQCRSVHAMLRRTPNLWTNAQRWRQHLRNCCTFFFLFRQQAVHDEDVTVCVRRCRWCTDKLYNPVMWTRPSYVKNKSGTF